MRINVGIPARMPHILRGLPELTVLDGLTERTCRGMHVAAHIAHVINRPALTFADHQYLILPGLAALGQLHPQGMLRASVLGIVEALETSALSGRVVRLEKGSDFSSALC